MTHFLMLLLDYALIKYASLATTVYNTQGKKASAEVFLSIFIICHHYKTVFYYNVFHSDLFGAWCCN